MRANHFRQAPVASGGYMQSTGSSFVSAQATAPLVHFPSRHETASHCPVLPLLQEQQVGAHSSASSQTAPSGFVPVSFWGLAGHWLAVVRSKALLGPGGVADPQAASNEARPNTATWRMVPSRGTNGARTTVWALPRKGSFCARAEARA